jgi:hypothetical protein
MCAQHSRCVAAGCSGIGSGDFACAFGIEQAAHDADNPSANGVGIGFALDCLKIVCN